MKEALLTIVDCVGLIFTMIVGWKNVLRTTNSWAGCPLRIHRPTGNLQIDPEVLVEWNQGAE